MRIWNRRDVVRGFGVAGLAAIGPARAAAATASSSAPAGTGARVSPEQVLREIQLSGEAERAFLARLGPGAAPLSRLPERAAARPARDAEAEVVEKLGPDGRVLARGLGFACDARVLNRLTVGGTPLVARRFCFSAGEVGWTPGPGFPFYEAFCPRYDYGAGAYYPDAKWHQVVPVLGGRLYGTGCQASDVCESRGPEALAFDVNDSRHDDHQGGYRITLWAWS